MEQWSQEVFRCIFLILKVSYFQLVQSVADDWIQKVDRLMKSADSLKVQVSFDINLSKDVKISVQVNFQLGEFVTNFGLEVCFVYFYYIKRVVEINGFQY